MLARLKRLSVTRKTLIWSALLLVLLVLPITIAMVHQVQDLRQRAAEPTTNSDLNSINTEILKFVQEKDLNASSGQRTYTASQERAISELQGKLTDRKSRMLALAKEDPDAFLRFHFPKEVRNQFPEQVRSLIEEEGVQRGRFIILHSDDFQTGKSTTEYQLHGGENLSSTYKRIQFGERIPRIQPGAVVEISGVSLDAELVPTPIDGDDPGEVIEERPPLSTTGVHRYLVILFNFKNDKRTPTTPAEIRSLLFTSPSSSNNFFKESSYGKTSLVGNVFGWYTLPINRGAICDEITWATTADAVAKAHGVNVDAYTRRMYIFPQMAVCGFDGRASVGGNPSLAWIQAPRWKNTPRPEGLFSHEIGHNFGLNHANTHECGTKSVGSFATYFQDCPGRNTYEYGDPYATMGNNSRNDQFNAPHRVSLGWIPPAQVQTVTDTGTYTITPLESAAGNKVMKIPIGNTGYDYYISYRQRGGHFDAALPALLTRGVSLHFWMDFETSGVWGPPTEFVDTTPRPDAVVPNLTDKVDSTLSDGRSFTDPENGITVTQLSHTAGNASLRVELRDGVCTRGIPEVWVSPFTYLGLKGQSVKYGVVVRNTDSFSCGPTRFQLLPTYENAAKTAGWSLTLKPESFPISAGGRASTIVTSTSTGDAALGSYGINMRLTGSDARHTVEKSATHIIAASLPTSTPTPRPVAKLRVSKQEVDLTIPQGRDRVAFTLTSTGSTAYLLNGKPVDSPQNIRWQPQSGALRNGQQLQIRITVGAGVPAGVYKGTATVTDRSTPGSASLTIPVRVRVTKS